MVLHDPHRKWAPRGICRWEDRHLFFAPGGQPNRSPAKVTQERWNQAKEICAMCPVLKECARDTLGEEYGVFGGLDEHQRYLIRRRLYKAIWNWPASRRLAWGEEIHTLREAGLTWSQILTRTGIPAGAGERLLAVYTETLKETEKSPAEIVDLPLPEVVKLDKRPFPGRPGRRNCWVRQHRIVSDAYYRGQTPDGAWVKVQLSERASRHRWVRAEDVHMYYPQPVIVMNYVGRPDVSAA